MRMEISSIVDQSCSGATDLIHLSSMNYLSLLQYPLVYVVQLNATDSKVILHLTYILSVDHLLDFDFSVMN